MPSAKGLDCVFHILYTQRGRVWFTHAMPFPCHATNMPFWKRPLKATAGERHGMCELASAVQRRHVDDLPVFGFFRLPRGVPGGCYKKHTDLRCRWPVWNQATFVMDQEKIIILLQGHECLYNLQNRGYDNSLVKDNCWKETAGEWQGSGRIAAWKRHGMCELHIKIIWVHPVVYHI
jgi:hypothetical protein